METSKLVLFIQRARLRQWLARPDLPIFVKLCSKLVESFLGRVADRSVLTLDDELDELELDAESTVEARKVRRPMAKVRVRVYAIH